MVEKLRLAIQKFLMIRKINQMWELN